MKMSEIIDKVSELYRSELKASKTMHKELEDVTLKLMEADKAHGENITLANYQYLKARRIALRSEIDLHAKYCNGISAAREILMDLDFDTEVT
jgi:hypothetical protein